MCKQFNNGACKECENIGCEFLTPVNYIYDNPPFTIWGCENPETGIYFKECPKGIREEA